MADIPREEFVPPELRYRAAYDEPIPIGFGQTISQPTVVGIMTTALELTGTERVLEVGTGSGYQAAVLSRLAERVYTIEVIAQLSLGAHAVIESLGMTNVSFRIGNGYLGWPDEAPFDRIICTAAPPHRPVKLLKQLGPGGIMVAPVGVHYQVLIKTRRTEAGFETEELGGVRFVPMVGEQADEEPN